LARSAPPVGRRFGLSSVPFASVWARLSPWISAMKGFSRPRRSPIPRSLPAPGAVAHFEDGPVRQLLHRLKYSDRMELAKPLGAWMARAGNELLVEADLLVPVPMHRRRLAARRFNQANSLAQAISAQCGVPVDPFVLA
jgi:hypothetical protein